MRKGPAGHVSCPGLLLAFPRVYKGTHTRLKAVSFLRGRSIRIESDKPLMIQADGEYTGQTPAARSRKVIHSKR